MKSFHEEFERSRRRAGKVEFVAALASAFFGIAVLLACVAAVVFVASFGASFVDCMDRVGDVWACLNP